MMNAIFKNKTVVAALAALMFSSPAFAQTGSVAGDEKPAAENANAGCAAGRPDCAPQASARGEGAAAPVRAADCPRDARECDGRTRVPANRLGANGRNEHGCRDHRHGCRH